MTLDGAQCVSRDLNENVMVGGEKVIYLGFLSGGILLFAGCSLLRDRERRW